MEAGVAHKRATVEVDGVVKRRDPAQSSSEPARPVPVPEGARSGNETVPSCA